MLVYPTSIIVTVKPTDLLLNFKCSIYCIRFWGKRTFGNTELNYSFASKFWSIHGTQYNLLPYS